MAGLCTVMPPSDASGQPVGLADEFDVPVIVRHSSPLRTERRPSKARIDCAWSRWPAQGYVAPTGDYLLPTTWRDLMDAAMTVGRDAFAWLTAVPGLARAEIMARRSPLAAYLHRVTHAGSLLETTGYCLQPNVVYQEGTEKTARALFAYRIGMTMAEWACRGLMGLQPTIHAEAVPRLPGLGPLWSPKNGQPDLVGFQWHTPEPWLIEAKAARRAGKTQLSKGVRQLSAPGLMDVDAPHVRVLCGTSIEHRIFMTIDIESHSGGAPTGRVAGSPWPNPDEDDNELFALARSRMLTYYALRGLSLSSLSVRPVGPEIASAQLGRDRSAELVIPLERDESTRSERILARNAAVYNRRSPSARFDMLTGQVPGTDLILGMSRRLFAACRALASEEAQLIRAVQADLPYLSETSFPEAVDEDTFDDRIRERRTLFAEQEADIRDHLSATTRSGYDIGRESSWQELINFEPQLIAEPSADLLESATADTYLAIEGGAIAAG